MSEHRVPSNRYFLVLLGWLAFIGVLAFTVGVQPAMYTLAGSLAVLALIRLAVPNADIPFIRSRAFDVLTLLAFAVILGYFANWGDTPAL
ncbi:MAG: DUF3017 domain-containing protein [Arcanobacterium sp.]